MKRKNKHLDKRLFRIQAPVSKYDIKRAIDNGSYKSIKRLSVARRLAYVYINEYTIKIVLDRNTKDIITILPMNYKYSQEFKFKFDEKLYRLTIFPDCYMETLDCRMLTSFEQLNCNTNEWKPIKMKGSLFKSMFDMCWFAYKKKDNESESTISIEKISSNI